MRRVSFSGISNLLLTNIKIMLISILSRKVTKVFVIGIQNKNKKEKSEKYKKSVCFVYIGTCVPWMDIEIKFSKFCIFCNLDEHLYAQLSK